MASPAPSPFKGSRATTRRTRPTSSAAMPMPELVVANLLAARLTLLFARAASASRSCTPASRPACGRWAIAASSRSSTGADAAASLASALRSGERSRPRGRRSVGLAGTIAACADRTGCDLVVVLDQFEEYFVYHPDQDGRPSARSVRVIPDRGVREETALARLERFKGGVPGLFDTYLRLYRRTGMRPARRSSLHLPVAPPPTPTHRGARTRRARARPGRGRAIVLAGPGADRLEPGLSPSSDGCTAGRGAVPPARPRPPVGGGTPRRLAACCDSRRSAARNGSFARTARCSPSPRAREQKVAADVFRFLVSPSGTKIALAAANLAETRTRRRGSRPCSAGLRQATPASCRPAGEDAYDHHDVLAAAILTGDSASCGHASSLCSRAPAAPAVATGDRSPRVDLRGGCRGRDRSVARPRQPPST